MRQLGTLMLVLALAAPPASAQSDDGYVERGPRFLLASAKKKEPVRVDTRKTPVLRQRISLDLQGVTLGEALRDVSSKSGVRLAFSDAVLPPGPTVEFRADNITVAAALTELLIDAEVDILFSRDGGGVVVRRQNPQVVIRGTVTDSATGSSLEGASITVVGTDRRAETNSSGQYVLTDVAPGTVVIRAHLIGYHPAERRLTAADGADLTVDFVLAPGVAQLEEIVAVGYGTATRGELASAISSVKAEDLASQPIASVDARAPGQGARRPGGPERRQPGQRPERAGPRRGIGLGQQRSALRHRRRAHGLERHLPARRGRPEHRRAQRRSTPTRSRAWTS